MADKEILKSLADDIKQRKNLMAFTGAGVSTLSGIPDFRTDKSGIWDRHDQSKIFDINYFKKNPADFYIFSKECAPMFNNAVPGKAHILLAVLEEKGYLKSIATQNIDGLHQKAGSKLVYELHGSPAKAHCLSCGQLYHNQDVEILTGQKGIPFCNSCGGLIKPDIVFYGEMLPQDALDRAFTDAANCDMMLILGTSLVVYPAAYVPETAIRNNVPVAILNKNETTMDKDAKYVINDDLDVICSELLEYF